MKDDPASYQQSNQKPSRWTGAIAMLIVIVGVYLLREHWGHVLGVAPYLLLLACPLMHFFMHGGHDHNAHHSHGPTSNQEHDRETKLRS